MISNRQTFHTIVGSLLLVLTLEINSVSAQAKASDRQPAATPWGVSASASSFKNHAEWFPKMRDAGVTTVRLFPEWRGFEPNSGTWNWNDADALVKAAKDNSIEINAILMGSPPGAKTVHVFPMDKLDDWSKYVSSVVGR